MQEQQYENGSVYESFHVEMASVAGSHLQLAQLGYVRRQGGQAVVRQVQLPEGGQVPEGRRQLTQPVPPQTQCFQCWQPLQHPATRQTSCLNIVLQYGKICSLQTPQVYPEGCATANYLQTLVKVQMMVLSQTASGRIYHLLCTRHKSRCMDIEQPTRLARKQADMPRSSN